MLSYVYLCYHTVWYETTCICTTCQLMLKHNDLQILCLFFRWRWNTKSSLIVWRGSEDDRWVVVLPSIHKLGLTRLGSLLDLPGLGALVASLQYFPWSRFINTPTCTQCTYLWYPFLPLVSLSSLCEIGPRNPRNAFRTTETTLWSFSLICGGLWKKMYRSCV